MKLPEQIAAVLTPDLGSMTADSVARHLCAKHQVGEGPIDPDTARKLQETSVREKEVLNVPGSGRPIPLGADEDE